MPCNAIARVNASIPNEQLAKLLTPDVIKAVVGNLLKQRGMRFTIDYRNGLVWFYVGQITIRVQGTKVEVWGGYRSDNEELAQAISAVLAQTPGVLFQAKVKALLAKKYAITNTVKAPNGSIVVSMEV